MSAWIAQEKPEKFLEPIAYLFRWKNANIAMESFDEISKSNNNNPYYQRPRAELSSVIHLASDTVSMVNEYFWHFSPAATCTI